MRWRRAPRCLICRSDFRDPFKELQKPGASDELDSWTTTIRLMIKYVINT